MKTFIRMISVVALSLGMALWGLDAFTALAAGKSPSVSSPSQTEKSSSGPTIAEATGTATLNGKVTLKSAASAPDNESMQAFLSD